MKTLENKIPPPVVTVLFAVAIWGVAMMTPVLEINLVPRVILSLMAVILGAAFCLAGFISFKRADTTINPLKPETASSLVIAGVYQYTRNPMYVGFTLLLVAWAIFLSSVWGCLGVLGFILYINQFQIKPEERALTELFGADFESYQSVVRRWL